MASIDGEVARGVLRTMKFLLTLVIRGVRWQAEERREAAKKQQEEVAAQRAAKAKAAEEERKAAAEKVAADRAAAEKAAADAAAAKAKAAAAEKAAADAVAAKAAAERSAAETAAAEQVRASSFATLRQISTRSSRSVRTFGHAVFLSPVLGNPSHKTVTRYWGSTSSFTPPTLLTKVPSLMSTPR